MKRNIIIAILFVLIVCLTGFIPNIKIETNKNSNIQIYTSKEFHVSLKYNKDWKLNPSYGERYDGKDGFFQVYALDGDGWTIKKAAQHVVEHKLKPFGTHPQIYKIYVQGHEARLIMPSKDQVSDDYAVAEIIVKSPKPIKLNGYVYHYLILAADKDHIKEIAKTIKFI